MVLNLDHQDMVALVLGTAPYYDIFNDADIVKYGSYSENRGWSWERVKLEQLPDHKLLKLYVKCKLSWKDK